MLKHNQITTWLEAKVATKQQSRKYAKHLQLLKHVQERISKYERQESQAVVGETESLTHSSTVVL